MHALPATPEPTPHPGTLTGAHGAAAPQGHWVERCLSAAWDESFGHEAALPYLLTSTRSAHEGWAPER